MPTFAKFFRVIASSFSTASENKTYPYVTVQGNLSPELDQSMEASQANIYLKEFVNHSLSRIVPLVFVTENCIESATNASGSAFVTYVQHVCDMVSSLMMPNQISFFIIILIEISMRF